MRQDHRFRKEKGLTAEQKRLIPLAVLAAVVVVLIAVILLADRGKNEPADAGVQPAAESMAESSGEPEPEEPALPDDMPEPGEEPESTEAAEPETAEAAGEDPYAGDTLQRDSMPELLDVMKRYFAARADADVETVNTLYGITGLSAEELRAEKLRLMSNSKYIAGFDDLATYVMEGTGENNWLVYSTVNIRFYTAKTKAPMVMWCFIERLDDGRYRMLDARELPQDMAELVNEANHSDAVRRLAGDVNARLNQALDTDADLKAVYGILRDGSPVYESEAEDVVVVDADGGAEASADAGETAAQTAAEPGSESTDAESIPDAGSESAAEAGEGAAGTGEGAENESPAAAEASAEAGEGAAQTAAESGSESTAAAETQAQ